MQGLHQGNLDKLCFAAMELWKSKTHYSSACSSPHSFSPTAAEQINTDATTTEKTAATIATTAAQFLKLRISAHRIIQQLQIPQDHNP